MKRIFRAHRHRRYVARPLPRDLRFWLGSVVS